MDQTLVLVAVGAPLVLGAAGATPSKSIGQGSVPMAVQVKWSAIPNAGTCRFFVEISRDGGTEWKKIATSAQYKQAAAAGGEPARIAALTALGLDHKENMDVVPAMAAGFTVIPFEATQGGAGRILVRVAADAAVTIDHAELVNYTV